MEHLIYFPTAVTDWLRWDELKRHTMAPFFSRQNDVHGLALLGETLPSLRTHGEPPTTYFFPGNTFDIRSRTSYSILCDNDSLYYFVVMINGIQYRLVACPLEMTDDRQRIYISGIDCHWKLDPVAIYTGVGMRTARNPDSDRSARPLDATQEGQTATMLAMLDSLHALAITITYSALEEQSNDPNNQAYSVNEFPSQLRLTRTGTILSRDRRCGELAVAALTYLRKR
jgi:hypothetical protein